jgi:hypothetical protein
MQRRQNHRLLGGENSDARGSWDLSDLLHPANAYEHPIVIPDRTLCRAGLPRGHD